MQRSIIEGIVVFKKKERSERRLWIDILKVALLSFLFLSFHSFYTSPFSAHDYGHDAAFYRLVGQGMTKGLLPYRDFYEMKGPFFYFIQYLSQIAFYGRNGSFFIQLINMIITILLVIKIFSLFKITSNKLIIILLLPLLYFLSFTIEGGNLTEEFSLPPLLLCLYFYFDLTITDNKKELQNKRLYIIAFIFGVCFGSIVMIRMTNAVLIIAMIIIISFDLLNERYVKEWLMCVLFFILGFVAIILPFVMFYYFKGVLDQMIDLVVFFGFKYSNEKTYIIRIFEIITDSRTRQILLSFIPLLIVLVIKWRNCKDRVFFVIASLMTFYVISIGNNYTHYYTLTIPLVLISEIAIVDSLNKNRINRMPSVSDNNIKSGIISFIEYRSLIANVLFIILLIGVFPIWFELANSSYNHLFHHDYYKQELEARDIAERIPIEDEKSVYGYEIDPAWYAYTDIFPCNKYIGWQNHYISLNPKIYDELETFFIDTPPKWLILPANKNELPNFIEIAIKKYKQKYSNDSYELYELIK